MLIIKLPTNNHNIFIEKFILYFYEDDQEPSSFAQVPAMTATFSLSQQINSLEKIQ